MPDRSEGLSHPAEWLVVLRVAVGLYFVKALVTKMSVVLAGGFLPFPVVSDRWLATMPKIVAKQASENPIAFYKQFLEQTVLTHADLFAHLTPWGETVAGLGLTLGINYGLATQWMSAGQQGFHLLLFTLMLAFFFSRAGRRWGLDGVVAERRPGSWLTRRPLS